MKRVGKIDDMVRQLERQRGIVLQQEAGESGPAFVIDLAYYITAGCTAA
jgi:hypothetical protein